MIYGLARVLQHNECCHMSIKKSEGVTPLRPKHKCPQCAKNSTREDYPFCSDRCRSLDLHKWLGGAYAIPAVEEDVPGDESDDG